MMTKKEVLVLLKEWERSYKELCKQFDKLHEVFPFNEAPLEDSVFVTFDNYTKVLSKLVGDKAEWLDWYCFENNFGEKKMKVKTGDKEKAIKNFNDLIEVLLEF